MESSMNQTMNAFHPKYIETYMPDFMKKVRAEAAATANGIKSGITARASRESDGSTTVSPLSDFPKTKPSLQPREFRVYSKAGAK
jgi:hypothetical protein